jgi:N-acetylglucosaminyldiphosphoundecaprenol N-acetyl-beta-D-mannosaminyltransferase
MTLQRQPIPVLGVDATPLDVDGLTAVLNGFVADGTTRTVVGHNLHSVTLFHSEPEFRKFYENSDVVLLDGAPVLGAGATANAKAVEKLQGIVPGAAVSGMPGEGWDPDLEEKAAAWLAEVQPQLVLIGLGMPLQEEVLWRRLPSLPPAVYCAVGGAIEQIAGIQKLAPRWLGRLGLEWAWRLLLHPRRVAYRVFGEPWVLLGLLLRRRLRGQG